MNTTKHRAALAEQAPEYGRDRLLTIAETAHLMGVTDRMIRRLVSERRIEFVKVGRHVRVRESVARAFLDSSTVPAVRPARWGAK